MKIIKSEFTIEIDDFDDYIKMIKKIEYIARHCYKSNCCEVFDDSEKFVKSIITRGHEAMIEHCIITVKIIADRGFLAELTRHRIASYAVESSRYCNYSKDKFNNEISFIDPTTYFNNKESSGTWKEAVEHSEKAYMKLIEQGETPQMARSVLPMSLKTEMIITANIREWRNIFKLRADKAAHPQMREIMAPLLAAFISNYPVFFEDLKELCNEYFI